MNPTPFFIARGPRYRAEGPRLQVSVVSATGKRS